MESNTSQPLPTNELSLKDIVGKLSDWLKYLWRKKIIIILFSVVGAALGVAYSLMKKPAYTGELTFVLEDSKSNPLSSYAGIASQFGFDLSGGAGSGIFSGDNILEFLKSRLMIEKTLLLPITADGKTTTLADRYIEVYELKDKWKKKSHLAGIGFPLKTDRKQFTLQQDSILNVLYEKILKQHLDVGKLDKKLSFVYVQCKTTDEYFSKYFTEYLVKEAAEFYIRTKTLRSATNVNNLQHKADSIEALLNRKTYSAAAVQDMNMNPARNTAGVATELATRDKLVLQTIYTEVVKNLEVSKMAMIQEAPVIQIVDSPTFPLEKETPGLLKSIVIGGFLFGFLTVLFLIFKIIYKEIMN